jgi:isoquinoline 1-oxidoreductase beta subunit
MSTSITRRTFLASSALTTGGLILGAVFRPKLAVGETSKHGAEPIALNAWLRIGFDDTVTIIVSQAEMGQGITTTLPAVVAEELGADWNRVKLENSPADPAYRNPARNWQFTGNSESTTAFFDFLRTMGASAREMLIAAAADKWKVDPTSCGTLNNRVIHRPTRRSLKFSQLAEAASKKQPPAKPRLKAQSEWQLLGKSLPRLENPAKVNGTAVFGLDFKIPGMVYAAVRVSPVFGGKVAKLDKSSVDRFPGVIDVVGIPNGVAVVGETYWQARKALEALKVDFDAGPNSSMSSGSLTAQYRAAINGGDWLLVHSTGNKDIAPPTIVTEEYESQFLAHATMEPMNCTARVTPDGCQVWGPTQGQELAQLTVSQMLGLPREKVQITRTLLGGGFGRRLLPDFVVQAVAVSKAVGRPVKVIWSREEDMQHDFYRPAVHHRITAGVDEYGRLKALSHRLVSPTILHLVFPPAVTETYDPSCLEGLLETHYAIPNTRVDFKLLKVPVPTSVMRTTGYGPNIFALESFIDELAQKKGQDPYQYRRELLSQSKRALAVLDLAAQKSAWNTPPPRGHYRGIAFCEAFLTVIAHVVELSIPGEGRIKIHRVVAVVDSGTILDRGITANSIEGGTAWGLSCADKAEITFEKGRVVQSNWHDYEVLRMSEMPPVEVHFIDSGARPLGGTGEVGPVTVIPALTNAIFAATGRRIRSLPLSRHGLRLA